MRRFRIRQSPQITNNIISSTLLSIGFLAVVYSIYSRTMIMAFIGLTLSLWGILFLFVLPENYVKKEVMDSISSSSLQTIDQMTSELNLEGRTIYIPFQKELYLKYNLEFKNEFVYVSKKNAAIGDTLTHAFMKNGEGLRLTPTGLGLANLIQQKSRQQFQNLDLNLLPDILSPLITRELGLAGDFEMEIRENEVYVKITKPITEKLCEGIKQRSPNVGCPICSSIACILTRATGKPLAIEKCLLENN
ncbi:hypothetical protein MUP77_08080, partial [Candidatus Bathyarchaeota archaeon]|nr:hypothetical protein [Candidatus Bathyarchaeota archaeon]